jgi:hypothetical protein
MAEVTHRLALPVGQYSKQGAEKPTVEYREIGVVMEFADNAGNKWSEVRLHVDALNPVLATLARQQMEKGTSSARVKMFGMETQRGAPSRVKPATPSETGPMNTAEPREGDDIPF